MLQLGRPRPIREPTRRPNPSIGPVQSKRIDRPKAPSSGRASALEIRGAGLGRRRGARPSSGKGNVRGCACVVEAGSQKTWCRPAPTSCGPTSTQPTRERDRSPFQDDETMHRPSLCGVWVEHRFDWGLWIGTGDLQSIDREGLVVISGLIDRSSQAFGRSAEEARAPDPLTRSHHLRTGRSLTTYPRFHPKPTPNPRTGLVSRPLAEGASGPARRLLRSGSSPPQTRRLARFVVVDRRRRPLCCRRKHGVHP